MERSLPVAERPRRPEWMKVRAPSADSRYFDVRKLLHGASLTTICEEARCPNIAECWGGGTATVMLMGEVCTRACRFCYVKVGAPPPLDPEEPENLARAVKALALEYIVVTSVNREFSRSSSISMRGSMSDARRSAIAWMLPVVEW